MPPPNSPDVLRTEQLVAALRSLPPWQTIADFGEAEWDAYIRTARLVQQADPDTVSAALDQFAAELRQSNAPYPGYELESVPFLLMRVVFLLPETVPVAQRFAYKGWSNWPDPDDRGEVNPGWPVVWKAGRPSLVASYAGSSGQPYPASAEYRFLLATFPFRNLG
jgi:hypothetical protein